MPHSKTAVKKLTRSLDRKVERELWARSAGRCEFKSCNQVLYISPITQERVNIAQLAHVYSFSSAGPRGRGPFAKDSAGLNSTENLMVVCYACHKKIDQDKEGKRYPAELLCAWKEEHETRIRIVSGISPENKSHVLLYGSRIGDEFGPVEFDAAAAAMFPTWFPADERPLNLSMACSHDDSTAEFFASESAHLRKEFERQVRDRAEEAKPNHFSVFALASQPLLILLGSMLTDKVPAVVYQLHREPPTWKWQPHPQGFSFRTIEPTERKGTPVLVLSLSAKIRPERLKTIVNSPLSVWEITIDSPHNDFLRSETQLVMFRDALRKMLSAIGAAYPGLKKLPIFPAMPVACAVELGRVRMPKADCTWQIYDQNNKAGKFVPALKIGDSK
jgi:hypothetical protein